MSLPTIRIIGSPVTALSSHEQMQTILEWAKARVSKTVCVANVHMLMEAHWHTEFKAVLQNADVVTPDGMPLVWMMKLMGERAQDRVPGLDILLTLCQASPDQGISVFFLGSDPETLGLMKDRLEQEFPDLKIAGMEPLPFRALTPAEDEALIKTVNESGAGIVFVALGCPKQEYWMSHHHDKIQAVMIGLGGAFPVYAGIHKRAPLWIRACGLEWLYRLIQEPRRLWGRYIKTIPPFIYLAIKQLLTEQKTQSAIYNQPQNQPQIK